MKSGSPYASLPAILAVLSLFVSSCSDKAIVVEEEREPRVPVAVEAYFGATKAGVADDAVQTLDVLAFRQDNGALDASVRTAGRTATFSVTANRRMDWYVIANAPAGSLNGLATKDAFLAASTRFRDNAGGAFLMEGHGSAVFTKEVSTINVKLDRYACKVSVDSIDPSFMATGIGQNSVTYVRAFLLNVCGEEPWSRTESADGEWFNRQAFDESLGGGLRSALESRHDRAVTSPEAFGVNDVLYCYPNPTDNGKTSKTNPEWCPRNTRLVLEFLIGGVPNYYPVTLPAMKSGNWYHLTKVTLIGQGTSDPDIPVTRTAITYTLTVSEWVSDEEDFTLDGD